ncbi:MAG: DUF6790 family protein [bacterium]
MYPLFLFCLAVILGLVQFLLLHKPLFSSFLLAFIVCNIGLQGIYAFMGHFFRSDETARNIGWPTGNLFQKEIAFTNLSLGVIGIMCIWFRGNFWLATIIARSVFLWGCSYIHFMDLKRNKNVQVFNAGPVLYFDFFFPFILIGFYILQLIYG